MPPIQKPMLAAEFDADKAQFPYHCTPKVDGIRFLMVGGRALSRSLKPIRNQHVQQALATHLPDGVDGELTVGDTFQSSTSGVMSTAGTPDFCAWLFDYLDPLSPASPPYEERMTQLKRAMQGRTPPFQFRLLLPERTVRTVEEVLEAAEAFRQQGFEGAMLRSPNGGYKFGRATVKQNTLLKVKDFTDSEATVVGWLELLHNENEATRNELGALHRSTRKEGRMGANTLGALLARHNGKMFKIGTGFTQQQRVDLWTAREQLPGRIVKFKYFGIGMKDKPRHPTFLGFRDPDDT